MENKIEIKLFRKNRKNIKINIVLTGKTKDIEIETVINSVEEQ